MEGLLSKKLISKEVQKSLVTKLTIDMAHTDSHQPIQ